MRLELQKAGLPAPTGGVPLTLADAVSALQADTIVPPLAPDVHVTGCFAADLMSDVLAFAREGALLLSGLTTDQTVRTAAIKHLVGIIVIEGKEIGSDMIEAANDEGIPVYRTALSKFEACGVLMRSGLGPCRAVSAARDEGDG